MVDITDNQNVGVLRNVLNGVFHNIMGQPAYKGICSSTFVCIALAYNTG